jgi:hypothetical protein
MNTAGTNWLHISKKGRSRRDAIIRDINRISRHENKPPIHLISDLLLHYQPDWRPAPRPHGARASTSTTLGRAPSIRQQNSSFQQDKIEDVGKVAG